MSYTDPRENVSHEIRPGNIYEDSRTGDRKLLLYADSERVLLRDEDGTSFLNTRKQFEEEVGGNRFKHQPEATVDTAPPVAKIERRAEEYAAMDGRKYDHYAEALQEGLALATGDTNPDDNESVDLESVSGVGEKTADALRASGYSTKGDFRSADRDELLDIGGVGETNLDRIMERV
jgi:hypothetical protein